MPQQPAGAEADDIIHASRSHVNGCHKEKSASWRRRQSVGGPSVSKDQLKAFDSKTQAKQHKSYGDQHKGDHLQMQYLHMDDELRQQVHCVDEPTGRCYDQGSPKSILLWWIKFHRFLSSEKMMDRVSSLCSMVDIGHSRRIFLIQQKS
jgi:hypothetical protein